MTSSEFGIHKTAMNGTIHLTIFDTAKYIFGMIVKIKRMGTRENTFTNIFPIIQNIEYIQLLFFFLGVITDMYSIY